MKYIQYFFHYILYYLAWYLCIVFAARDREWLGSVIVLLCVGLQISWLYIVQQQIRGLWLLVAMIACISTVIDSLLLMFGIVIFTANPWAPLISAPWMITLWISFAVNLYTLSDWISEHLLWLGLASFGGFAIAYAYGAHMDAAILPYGYKTCYFIGAIWVFVLPSIVWGYRKLMDRK